MEAQLQKYGWILNFAVIAIGAIILAFAASEVIAIYLAPYGVPNITTELEVEDGDKPRQPVRRNQNFARSITERCLFGCAEREEPAACEEPCEPGEVCQDGVCVPLEPQEQNPDGIPVLSDLGVKLLGAMVAASPEYSVALIQDPSSKTTYVAGVGEYISSDAEVVEIYRDRVILRRNGRLEFIKLDSTLQGNPSASRSLASIALPSGSPRNVDLATGTLNDKTPNIPAVGKDARKAVESAQAKKNEGVKKVGENEFVLERSAVEEQLSDPKKLAKQARIIPNYSGGKRDGIKLVGVTPSGVFGKIGIESGDVVHSINGQNVTSQNKAFELLNGLRKANNVKIEVERGGTRQTIEYSIK